MATRMTHDIEPDGAESFSWKRKPESRYDYTEIHATRHVLGHIELGFKVKRSNYPYRAFLDAADASKLIEALQKLNLYPAAPEPFRWAPLPEAFIGELGLYYPARMSEITALEGRGFIQRADDDFKIGGVPVWEPVDPDDGPQVTPEQIEAALAELRKK
jgi:hypothetical protein